MRAIRVSWGVIVVGMALVRPASGDPGGLIRRVDVSTASAPAGALRMRATPDLLVADVELRTARLDASALAALAAGDGYDRSHAALLVDELDHALGEAATHAHHLAPLARARALNRLDVATSLLESARVQVGALRRDVIAGRREKARAEAAALADACRSAEDALAPVARDFGVQPAALPECP